MFLVACSYFVYYTFKFIPISLEQISAFEPHIVTYGSMSILSTRDFCLWSLSKNHCPERPLFTKPFPNFGFKNNFSWPWSGFYKTRRWHEQTYLPPNSQSRLGFLPCLPLWYSLGLCHLLRAWSNACWGFSFSSSGPCLSLLLNSIPTYSIYPIYWLLCTKQTHSSFLDSNTLHQHHYLLRFWSHLPTSKYRVRIVLPIKHYGRDSHKNVLHFILNAFSLYLFLHCLKYYLEFSRHLI